MVRMRLSGLYLVLNLFALSSCGKNLKLNIPARDLASTQGSAQETGSGNNNLGVIDNNQNGSSTSSSQSNVEASSSSTTSSSSSSDTSTSSTGNSSSDTSNSTSNTNNSNSSTSDSTSSNNSSSSSSSAESSASSTSASSSNSNAPSNTNSVPNGSGQNSNLRISAACQDQQVATSFVSGDGTQANPYLICNKAQFLLIASHSGTASKYNYFQLAADIDFGGNRNSTTANHIPIRMNYGILDGKNYIIKGFVVVNTYSGTEYYNIPGQALFSDVGRSMIANLRLENFRIEAANAQNAGGLASNVGYSRFYNVHIRNGHITSHGHWMIGGIAGAFYRSELLESSALDISMSIGKGPPSLQEHDDMYEQQAEDMKANLQEAQNNGQELYYPNDSVENIEAWLADMQRRLPRPEGLPHGVGLLIGGSGNGGDKTYIKDCYGMGDITGYAHWIGGAIGGYGGGGSTHYVQNVYSVARIINLWDMRGYRDSTAPECSFSNNQSCAPVGGVYNILNGNNTGNANSLIYASDILAGKPTSSPVQAKTMSEMSATALYSTWDTSGNIWILEQGKLPKLKGEAAAKALPTNPMPN